jgi:hypothetical protein
MGSHISWWCVYGWEVLPQQWHGTTQHTRGMDAVHPAEGLLQLTSNDPILAGETRGSGAFSNLCKTAESSTDTGANPRSSNASSNGFANASQQTCVQCTQAGRHY